MTVYTCYIIHCVCVCVCKITFTIHVISYTVCVCVQGHVEAYGNYEELLAGGVELMQLIKTKDEGDEREIFSVHEDDEEEEDKDQDGVGEEGGGEGDREVVCGVNGVPRVVSAPHSPYRRKDIMYTTESESNLVSLSTKPKVSYLGDGLKQQFPPDTSSIYSAHSMLSIHSAVEAESSKHEEIEVRGGAGERL